MNATIYDIETGALPPNELEAAMPAKVRAEGEAAQAKWRDRAALDATAGRVLAIGLGDMGKILSGQEKPLILGDSTDSEPDILRAFWSLVRASAARPLFCGFNSHHFDLPFLARRSWRHGIAIPPGVFTEPPWLKPNPRRFIDLLDVWQCGDKTERISLGRLAEFFGEGSKTGSGADFAALWTSDRAAAADYLQNDILLTARVAARMLS